MALKKHILLGKITRTHGFDGSVIIRRDKNFSGETGGIESVFLEIDGRPVPFFIDYLEYYNEDLLQVKFQDYNNTGKVREFTGCNVYITTRHPDTGIAEDHYNFEGYTIITTDNVTAGIVLEVVRNPAQWLLRVNSDRGGEVLIPLHEDLVVEIDDNIKVIRMIIPEGLWDIK